ncbi:hypothetical protein B484DRAFT_453255 [Ochromonadaceae sp. CCMP2298]|nr:hypothetical protein B484DRAFT_453255 [Ochromonadaceae sp. CCMP2298]|eukprot:CAMPEP_0173224748 /NCGR_PEP_ID=MMETSP1142-20121109/4519_1 /TAXON_ID=483371 /ORGANISM="non described non described, Strain CCMP2298" /LENGTH=411 /DNA_ID=CAMNT_0014153065 /DNA_START=60 /DNA_END=1295 /DNA_ORIENTATION=+
MEVRSRAGKKPARASVSPAVQPAQLDWEAVGSWVLMHANIFVAGIMDSLSFHRTLRILVNDGVSARLVLMLVSTNGVLLLGSIFLYSEAIEPLLGFMKGRFTPTDELDTSDSYLWGLYQLLWLLPICALCYGCSTLWYQDLADNTYKYLQGVPKSSSLSKSVGNALYGTLVWASVFVQVKFLTVVAPLLLGQMCSGVEYMFQDAVTPSTAGHTAAAALEVAGLWVALKGSVALGLKHSVLLWLKGAGALASFLGLALMCVLYGWYAFDPKWIAAGLDPDARFCILERHWAYFLGFGFPYVLLLENTSFFTGFGSFLGLFPFCILLGSVTDYSAPYAAYCGETGPEADSVHVVPVFKQAKAWTLFAIEYIDQKAYHAALLKKPSKPSPAVRSSSNSSSSSSASDRPRGKKSN